MKTIIATAGRSGSTFLMIQLTVCGVKTGYNKEYALKVDAGLEAQKFSDEVDVVKTVDPSRPGIENCDRVLMLIRDPIQTAKSREARGKGFGGGPISDRAEDDTVLTVSCMNNFISKTAYHRKPIRFLEYPSFVLNPEVGWSVIKDLFPIDHDQWVLSHKQIYDPNKTHYYDGYSV
jgi:hypothetical protein